MLKIGEFSRLSQVTVKTLRYYDEIGLLKAATVDPFTNHRYYTVDQLSCIHRIIALKELGMSLQQITQMLNDNLELHEIRGMLKLKHAEIQQRVQAEQARLTQVEFRLRLLEVEEHMPDIEIVVKQVEAFHALSLRRTYATAEECQRFGDQLQPLVEEAIKQANVPYLGPETEIHHGDEFRFTDIDMEFVGRIDKSWTEDLPLGELGTFVVREVDRLETAATYMHDGAIEQLPEKLALVQRWAVANNYRLCDEIRLVHHRGPLHYKDANNLIEVQCKIEAN